jgi:tetratricopeptide (TPR) repeat protein
MSDDSRVPGGPAGADQASGVDDLGAVDFFVSYSGKDRSWAEWIAWQLESVGYTTKLQSWDFRPGSDFIHEMQQATTTAKRTIAVLSSAYFASQFAEAEWRVAFAKDPSGARGLLVPVRVEDITPAGLLTTRVYIDLVRQDAAEAKDALLRGVGEKGARPAQEPSFPGTQPGPETEGPEFPGRQPRVWNVLRDPNPVFTDREELFQKLENELGPEGSNQATPRIVLYGLGGVGKTQLVVEYAYQQQSSFDVVWWIRSDQSHTLVGDYAALATVLDLAKNTETDHNAAIDAAKQWLKSNQRWLIIFDNADDPAMVSGYLPKVGKGGVLITSRSRVWRRHATAMLEVPTLSSDDAVKFLLARTGDANRQAARIIAERLGNLPLALEQAGAYVEETGVAASAYVEKLRQRPEKIFAEGQPPDYEQTVLTTWQVSLDRIRQDSLDAVDLLNLCAYLSPDAIPDELFHRGADLLPTSLGAAIRNEQLDEIIGVPRRYSLVSRSGETFSMHRLVQDVIRGGLDNEQQRRWATVAVRLVERSFPPDSADTRNWDACQRMIPHALAVAEHSDELQVARGELSLLLDRAALYLRLRGQFKMAKEAYERVFSIDEAIYGPKHLSIATDLNTLGSSLQDLGELARSRQCYIRALDITRTLLGRDHPRVAVSLNNLGSVEQEAGNLAVARDWLKQGLSIQADRSAANYAEVVVLLNNLGSVRQDLGDLKGAREAFEKVVALRVADHGPTHASVAAAKNNLGSILNDLGHLNEARAMLEEALHIRETVFGPTHPSLGVVLSNLGMVFHDLGKFDKAGEHYRRALEIDRAGYTEQHHKAATDLNNLGSLAHELGQRDEAKASLEKALTIRETIYHSEHPGLAAVLNNLGSLYQDLDDAALAKRTYERALRIREAAYGPDHLFISFVLSNYGTLLRDLRELDAAHRALERALAIQRLVLAQDHPSMAATLNNLGSLLLLMSKREEAEVLLNQALRMYEVLWGGDHYAVATVLINQADVMQDRGDRAGAAAAYRRAIDLQEAAYGPQHPKVMATRNALARL